MKKYSITIAQRGTSFEPKFCEVIEGDSLIEVLSKLILSIAKLQKELLDEEYKRSVADDDDIPF